MAFPPAFMLKRCVHQNSQYIPKHFGHVFPCRTSTLSSTEKVFSFVTSVDSLKKSCFNLNSFTSNFCFSLSATQIYFCLRGGWILQIEAFSKECFHKRPTWTTMVVMFDEREDIRKLVPELFFTNASSNLLSPKGAAKR